MSGIIDSLTHLPKQYYFIVGIAVINFVWNRVSTSERFLRIIVLLFPNSSTAHFDLGSLLSDKAEQREEAEKELRQAIAIKPNFRNSYYALAGILWEKPNWDEEIQALCTKMFELFPDDPMTYLFLGYMHAKRGSVSEAEDAYREAIFFAPRFVTAYEYLVNLLARQNRHVEAIQIYDQAPDILPRNTEKFYIIAANALFIKGEYSEAADAYKKGHQLVSRQQIRIFRSWFTAA